MNVHRFGRFTRFALGSLAASLLAIVLQSGQVASAQEKLDLVEPGYLTVAVFANRHPVIGYDNNDVMQGVDGGFFKAFAESHGLKVKIYKTTFSSTILAVQQGKVDIGTWFYYTPERAKQVRYTFPFLKDTAAVYTMGPLEYTGPDSLKGKVVSTVVGYSWAPYVQEVFGSNAKLFPDGTVALAALANGQVDAYIDTSWYSHSGAFAATGGMIARPLSVGDFGMPESVVYGLDYNFVRCGNKALAEALNAEMTALHESGKWAGLLEDNGVGDANLAPLRAPEQLCE